MIACLSGLLLSLVCCDVFYLGESLYKYIVWEDILVALMVITGNILECYTIATAL